MRALRQIPLQKKASLAMLAVAFALVGIAFGAFLFFQLQMLRFTLEDNIGALAKITAVSCGPAIARGDTAAVTHRLEALHEFHYFHSARIELADGRELTLDDEHPSPLHAEDPRFIVQEVPISSGGEVLGTLNITGDYGTARAEMVAFVTRLAGAVLTVCILIGWLLARRAQKFLLQPVIDLATTAERIARDRDLSLRVNRTADDEIGLLTERFNEMLAQVESQDRRLKEARKELESKVIALEFEISERRRVEAGLAEVTEREERRLANDLHDGLGQLLTGIAFKAHLLRTLLSENESSNSKLATEVVELANESIKQARDIAHGVAPIDLAGEGLAQALAQLCSQVERLMGATCTLHVPDEITGMPLRTSIELYRICQEAAHNAARHGHARKIDILLEERNAVWRLEIRDNGNGLPPPENRGKGLGLRLMSHRAETVGGTIAFFPNEPKGLIVRCAVPVSRPARSVALEGKPAGH